MYYDKELQETLPVTKPVTPPLEPYQQTCLEAANYIRKHGWCQNVIEDDTGRVCIYGALEKAASYNSDAYCAAVRKVQNELGMPIDDYNDGVARTVSDVLNLLETVGLKGK